MRSVCLIATVCVLAVSSAHAADVPLCRNTHYINRQFVPTADIAKAIYKAVGLGLNPNLLKEHPIVEAIDAGDHWEIGQKNDLPPPKAGPNEVIVTFGGGQLYMKIDKCSGAVSDAAFNR